MKSVIVDTVTYNKFKAEEIKNKEMFFDTNAIQCRNVHPN